MRIVIRLTLCPARVKWDAKLDGLVPGMTQESAFSKTLAVSMLPVSPGKPRPLGLVLRVAANPHFTKAPLVTRHSALHLPASAWLNLLHRSKSMKSVATRWGGNQISIPHDDNIVRVQISHLRKKLSEHFATEGKDEKLRSWFRKGHTYPASNWNAEPAPLILVVAYGSGSSCGLAVCRPSPDPCSRGFLGAVDVRLSLLDTSPCIVANRRAT